MKISRTKVFWGLVMVADVIFLLVIPFWQMIFLPAPYNIELPEFHGRILPAEKITPGTFAIHQDFDDVSSWGGESILSYGRDNTVFLDTLILKAWRPDQKTAGAFEYAKKVCERPEAWGICHMIGEIHRDENNLVVHPEWSKFFILIIMLGILIAMLIYGSYFEKKNS